MKVVYTAADMHQAEYIRSILDQAGIRALIEGDILGAAAGEIPRYSTYPRISVDDARVAEAIQLITESGVDHAPPSHCRKCGYDLRGLPEPRCPECGHPFQVARARPLSWTCPVCGEVLGGQFTACWNCGAGKPADDAGSSSTIITLGPEDAGRLDAYLLPRLDEAMFLLANSRAAGVVDTNAPQTGCYAAEIADGEIVGVVAHFWNGMLIPCAPVDRVSRLGQAALAASRRDLRGLIGPREQVETLAQALNVPLKQEEQGPVPEALRLDSIEGLYALELSRLEVPAALAAGQVVVRRGTAVDLPLLIDWDVRYAFESLGATDRAAQLAISESYQRRFVENGHVFLLIVDGRPVARALYNAAIREAVQIGGVWTLPELRGRRYARAVVAGALLAAREQGVERAILFTEHTNTHARRAYDALGFGRVGEFRLTFLR